MLRRVLCRALLTGYLVGFGCLVGSPTATAAKETPVRAAVDPSVVDALPAYVPETEARGTIRLWGHGSPKHDFMGDLVQAWIAAFRATQPGVGFRNQMYGTASAIGALYTGAGDVAILGEEVSPAAAKAFKRAKGYAPTCVQIATGSVDTNYFDYAHMIFVHRDNPLDRLTVPQLEAIFGAEPKKSDHEIRHWGELGLGGTWATEDIHPYGWKVDEDFALFFRERILGDSHRWNPDIREFVTYNQPDGTPLDRGRQIIDALAKDRDGIAIANVRFATPEVKPLLLKEENGPEYLAATPENLISQRYPLTRVIPACIDRKPGEPVPPAVREFLRFVLSREGQRALLQKSGYLPLSPAVLDSQRAVLR